MYSVLSLRLSVCLVLLKKRRTKRKAEKRRHHLRKMGKLVKRPEVQELTMNHSVSWPRMEDAGKFYHYLRIHEVKMVVMMALFFDEREK